MSGSEQKLSAAILSAPVVSVRDVSLHYGKIQALDHVSVDVPSRTMVGMIGPDGVGKSSLLSLVTGAHAMQEGDIIALGGSMRDKAHRDKVCPKIAYMPQGLGKNLYFTLTVEENLQFFARLFGHDAAERRRRIDRLTKSTGLYPFLDRPAGKLSGGMKQKLGLCCALIHDPDLLVLDEPTTGVDPLARRQFWDLIDKVRAEQPQMGVIVATAYMDEAQRFDWLIAMDDGKILDTGTPQELLAKTGCSDLDSAFIRLLPESKRSSHHELVVPPLENSDVIAIEAKGLTKRFGSFTAVDHVSFRIQQGEIFGFLGSNGCGKTTTMRMLTGLLPSTEGEAWLFGKPIADDDMEVRKNLGYMTQIFSLYGELTVKQNLFLYARLFCIPEEKVAESVQAMLDRFELNGVADMTPESLPLGIKQRLSLAAAVIHHPKLLILDEPTSGVDPVARDGFWELIIELSRKDKVTIFVTTHFMNEAARCDRISLMHSGRSLACDTPAALVAERKAGSLEEAFIGYLTDADPGTQENAVLADGAAEAVPESGAEKSGGKKQVGFWHSLAVKFEKYFDFQRFFCCCWRENLELMRDRFRASLAMFGALLLLLVIGFGISMDVEDLSFAVLDRDQSVLSNSYALNISGSRYFIKKRPVTDYRDLDQRLRSGELSMVVELPPKFGEEVYKGMSPEVAFWIDGSNPQRAETVRGYISSMHSEWLGMRMREKSLVAQAGNPYDVQIRYRYNPDVMSLPAMVPAVIPVLLMMIPAILAALAVVREKEMGSIINLYVTPLTRAEFILGKQMPYVFFSVINFTAMLLLSVFVFDVPVKGSLPLLVLSLFVYCLLSTGIGLLASSVTRSQIAVIFMTMLGTMLPAVQFCGLINPVETLSGMGRVIGMIYPTTHMLLISRGIFSKALYLNDLTYPFFYMIFLLPVILGGAILLQKKQDS